jgi:sigma-B regulation protein RsbU (phosphoserine phosphatase)
MSPAGRARILVCASHDNAVAELRRVLQGPGHDADGCLLGPDLPADPGRFRLVVVEGAGQADAALDFCRRLRARLADRFVPVLVVTDDPAPDTRLASFAAGADACLLRPFLPGELTAQAAALLRIKETHDRLAEKTAEVHRINRRLQQAYQQIDEELALAQRIQSSFLPQTLPQAPHVRFAAHYLLCGRVGGDFYDIFRLDETHVGFYVADAMGHGVPASLLTIFIKKGVKAKEVFGSQYRLVPPDEVLFRLNRDLIDQRLAEQPFITMVYGLFNHNDGTLQIARAGHPYPLHVPRHGEVSLWKQHGVLLGVLDAQFPPSTRRLAVGDKLLFYSDGVDAGRFGQHPAGAESLLACAERHRALPVQDFIARLACELFTDGPPPDDLTLLGLERCD